MLSILRKKARSIFIYVIFVIIIIVFIFFFGWGDIREKQENWFIKINGRSVSHNTYLKYYNQLVSLYQRMYKDNFSNELVEKLGIKQKATDNLLENLILLDLAEKAKMITPETETKKAIREAPVFQSDGEFDFKKYNQLLRLNRISPKDFENEQRQEATASLMRDFVLNGVKCSKTELWEQFKRENEKINLEYIEIAPEAIEVGEKSGDEEIRKYYDDNKEAFRMPDKVKIDYIEFSPKYFEKEAEVSQKEIDGYYRDFSEEFWEPKKVHARHILIKANPSATAAEKENAKKRVEEILSMIKGGKPFEEMAKQHSEDPASALEGGDLGFFPQGQMVKPFEEEAFRLNPGEVSNIVETEVGFHIIKVDEIKAEGARPLEEVAEKIKKELTDEKTRELCKKEAHRAYRALLKNKNTKKYADENGLHVIETDYFSKEKTPPPLGLSDELREELFSSNPEEIVYPYFLIDSYYVIKLLDKQKSQLPLLEEAKEKIVSILKKQKQIELAKRKGDELLKKLKDGNSLEETAKQEKLAIKETGLFTRVRGNIPQIGTSFEMAVAAFSLSPDKAYPDKVFEVNEKACLISLKSKEEASQEEFKNKNKELEKRYVVKKSEQYFQDWLKNARLHSAIVFNSRFTP
ncbi:MAG: SurA N-terminal domain-containing protein [Pseudomonadota bacterium]